jgi:hypothetical protein
MLIGQDKRQEAIDHIKQDYAYLVENDCVKGKSKVLVDKQVNKDLNKINNFELHDTYMFVSTLQKHCKKETKE